MKIDVKICFYATLLFCLLSAPCNAQITMNDDVEFAYYLFENRKFDEIILLFEEISPELKQCVAALDSINHILGMTYYYRKELEKSALHLSQVSKSSEFYAKSVFFSALNHSHLGNYELAQTILEAAPNGKYEELQAVKLAGIGLLKRDFEMFAHHSQKFKFEQFYYVNSQNQLLNIRQELNDFSPKSPLIAGSLSMVAPGLGKIYAGQTGDGIATFITVGALAAITAENWIKNGLSNWKTITFGSAFAIFYTGNIIGSVASVKVYRNKFNEKHNNAILLCIHLPVRALFE